MARTKQPAVKRESSSEYFNRHTATWEDANGTEKKRGNGHQTVAVEPRRAVDDLAASEAGLVQLVISVAGIYASL